ncbi:MAG: hypothetical protein ACLUE1_00585 [Adlercreutzia equolifaciens]
MGAEGGTVGISDMLLRNRERSRAFIDGRAGGRAKQRLLDGRMPKSAIVMGSTAIVRRRDDAGRRGQRRDDEPHQSPALDDSATKSIKRDIGRRLGFGDGPDSSSAPIESASLALWAARTTKRDPRRKQEASF